MPASPETTSTPRNAAAGRLRAREPRLPAPVWRALGRLSRRQHLIVSGCLIAFVAWIDLVTGERLSVSVFYVAPIFLLTWFVGRRAGLVGAFLCATLRLALALADGSSFPRLVVLWNTDVELGFFLLGAFAFGALKEALSREQALMRTDQLTGLASRHAFFDRLALEVGRNRRDGSSMILAIVDLDDLRGVNDRHGHEFGDAILRRVATRYASDRERKTSTNSSGKLPCGCSPSHPERGVPSRWWTGDGSPGRHTGFPASEAKREDLPAEPLRSSAIRVNRNEPRGV